MKNRVLLFAPIILFSASASFGQHPCAAGKIAGYEYVFSAQPEANPGLLDYDMKYVKLDVKVERQDNDIEGSSLMKAQVVNGPLTQYVCELIPDLDIDSVKINGITSSFSRSGDDVIVTVNPAIPQGSLFTAQVFYGGTPPNGGFFNGMSNGVSQSWGNRVTWTLSQPYSAKQWWPTKQVLSDKIDSIEVWITTDSVNKAGSNGILKNITSLGNKKRFEWESHYPIDYYLISLSVARYIDYTITANPVGMPPVTIQNFIYDNPQTLPFFQNDINQTVDMLEFFSTIFGEYPFSAEKYGHCMAPFSGGMEHQTMTTQGFFNQDLTAHELGHQWFGDQVTCAQWKDLWVNEGFASYSEYLYREHLSGITARQWMDDVHTDVMSQPDGSVYVSDTSNLNRLFSSRLTYNKGAAILHTLRFALQSDSLFFAILKSYQQQFGGSTTVGNDVKQLAESLSGMNLTQFFDQWYYGEGYPVIGLNQYYNASTQTWFVQPNQTVSAPGVTPFFRTPLEIGMMVGGQDTTVLIQLDSVSPILQFQLSAAPTALTIDPNQWILNGTAAITENPLLNTQPVTETEFRIFPNPATDLLNIQATSEIEILRIFDANGKLLQEQQSSGGNTLTVDVSNWNSGMYWIQINRGASKSFVVE